MSNGPSLAGLHSGASGRPASPTTGGGGKHGAVVRHQQQELGYTAAELGWDDATLLARDAAQAYREVLGPRRQREQELEQQAEQPRPSTFL